MGQRPDNGPGGDIGIFLPRLAGYGGVERYGLGLAQALVRAGFGVTFVCARQEIPAPEGVRVIRVGRFGAFRAVKQLWFALAAQHVMRSRRFAVTVGLGKSWGHDLHRINQGPEAVFARLTEGALEPGWPRLSKRWRRRLSPETYVAMLAERRQLSRSRRVVYVSHLVRQWSLSAYPWAEETPGRIVYTRPDAEKFQPPSPGQRQAARAALGLSNSQAAIGFAATSYQRKGLASLLRAMVRLPENHVLLVAGGKPPGTFGRLATRLGVAKRVEFLGRLDNMSDLYHACDCCALPSFYDTASNAVLEAVACGLRVVASAQDGSSAFVPRASVVKNPADDQELADCLLRTLSAADWAPALDWGQVDSGYAPVVEEIRQLAAKK